MNLLILGAGGHGKVVKETAESMVDASGRCMYDRIAFLDDGSPEAIGKFADAKNFTGQFACAFVGVGNNAAREKLQLDLEQLGFCLPVLIHPTAYISKSAKMEAGTVVEPNASINASASVGRGCIISIGSIIDHDSRIGDFCHVNAGAICKAGSQLPSGTKLEAGQVILGYKAK